MSSLDDRLRRLATALNEPEIALESLQRWLRGFSLADRPVALLLLECMEYHGYGRLIHECRRLHDHLRQRLESRQDLAGLWLLFSLRPEAGEVDPSQLLKECDSLLRDAGLEG